MTFICPPTRKLVSSKCAPIETIQLHLKHFYTARNNDDVNLDGNVWWSTLYIFTEFTRSSGIVIRIKCRIDDGKELTCEKKDRRDRGSFYFASSWAAYANCCFFFFFPIYSRCTRVVKVPLLRFTDLMVVWKVDSLNFVEGTPPTTRTFKPDRLIILISHLNIESSHRSHLSLKCISFVEDLIVVNHATWNTNGESRVNSYFITR